MDASCDIQDTDGASIAHVSTLKSLIYHQLLHTTGPVQPLCSPSTLLRVRSNRNPSRSLLSPPRSLQWKHLAPPTVRKLTLDHRGAIVRCHVTVVMRATCVTTQRTDRGKRLGKQPAPTSPILARCWQHAPINSTSSAATTVELHLARTYNSRPDVGLSIMDTCLVSDNSRQCQ